jgi:hypothetical protein
MTRTSNESDEPSLPNNRGFFSFLFLAMLMKYANEVCFNVNANCPFSPFPDSNPLDRVSARGTEKQDSRSPKWPL